MNGLIKTLIKPDWDDNPKRSEILLAANLLQIGEFQLIQLAYKSWYKKELPEEKTSGELERDLKLWVRKQIGPIATPDLLHFTPGLPKTRSGKIMRRILRKIAANEHNQLGDTTTLADPGVVESLVNNRKNI